MILHEIDDTPTPTSTETVLIPPEGDVLLRSIGFGPDPWSHLVHFGAAYNPPPTGKGIPEDFGNLVKMADNKDTRKYWMETWHSRA